MTDQLNPLPPHITDAIFQSGGRKLVLVEGPDDELAFTEWFADRLGDVVFVAASGKMEVLSRLPDIQANRPDVEVYGIVDRDFATDAEIQAALADPSACCFLLRRYSIENYALDPQAVFDVLRVFLRTRVTLGDAAETESHLVETCRRLRTMMAANYVIRQHSNDLPLFPERHEVWERARFVTETAARIGIPVEEAEAHIAAREAEIDTALTAGFDVAYEFVNGKHLLCHVQSFANGLRGAREPSLSDSYLFSQLVEWRRNHPPPHTDLTEIVDRRIRGVS